MIHAAGNTQNRLIDRKQNKIESIMRSLAIGSFSVWFLLAFRCVPAPSYQIDSMLFSSPRQDESWMFAILAMMIFGFLVMLFSPKALEKKQTIAALGVVLVTAGSLLMMLCADSIAAACIGGAIAGTGALLYLATWMPMAGDMQRSELLALLATGFVCAAAASAFLSALPSVVACGVIACLSIISFAFRYPPSLSKPTENAPGRLRANISDMLAPSQHRHHYDTRLDIINLASLVLSFLGFSFFMGIVGFSVDSLTAQELLHNQAVIMAAGLAIAACLTALAAFVISEETFRTGISFVLGAALILLPMTETGSVSLIAASLAQPVLLCAFASVLASPPQAFFQNRSDAASAPYAKLASIAGIILIGTVAGGIVRTLVGLNATVLAYISMLALYSVAFGIFAFTRHRTRVEYVIKNEIPDEKELTLVRCKILAKKYPSLSKRELDVCALMLQNRSNARMAAELVVSENTVKTHVRHIYSKLGVRSRDEFMALAETIPLEQMNDRKSPANVPIPPQP